MYSRPRSSGLAYFSNAAVNQVYFEVLVPVDLFPLLYKVKCGIWHRVPFIFMGTG